MGQNLGHRVGLKAINFGGPFYGPGIEFLWGAVGEFSPKFEVSSPKKVRGGNL